MGKTRGIIIECGVSIEAEATTTISWLLDIDPKNSKALGDSSQALSFNHRINLIKDIKGITSEQSAKLQKFMEIRNKFAHIKKIQSFQDLFDWNKETKGIKTKLEQWYSDKKKPQDDQEEYFLNLFFELFKENMHFLQNICTEHLIHKGIEQGKTDFQVELLESIKTRYERDKEFNKILREESDKILKRWESELK